jgi:hypothetical protein
MPAASSFLSHSWEKTPPEQVPARKCNEREQVLGQRRDFCGKRIPEGQFKQAEQLTGNEHLLHALGFGVASAP